MSLIQRYVTKNPMRVESRRFFRKFLGMGKITRRAVTRGTIVMMAMYVVILGILLYLAHDISPDVSAYVELTILLMTASIGFYSAISGERERRTWDVLRSAPVTPGQIVFGKFLGGAAVVGLVWVLFLPFNIVNSWVYERWSLFGSGFSGPAEPPNIHSLRLLQLLLTDLVTLGSALFALSLTIFMSSRAKRSLTAMSIVLGALFIWVAITPLLAGGIGHSDYSANLVTEMTANPYRIVSLLSQISNPTGYADSDSFKLTVSEAEGVVFVDLFVLAVLSIVLVVWTEKTLNFSEDQVEFINKKKHA